MSLFENFLKENDLSEVAKLIARARNEGVSPNQLLIREQFKTHPKTKAVTQRLEQVKVG